MAVVWRWCGDGVAVDKNKLGLTKTHGLVIFGLMIDKYNIKFIDSRSA